MNTIFGNFPEKIIPNLKDAIIKFTLSGKDSEINLEDFKAAIAPEPSYKVFTALLTQSGGDDQNVFINSGLLTIGVTYLIDEIISGSPDFTNVGAPNNLAGTYFIATGTTPNSWGEDVSLAYVTAAPVVTVLENTIGNIWFTYDSIGTYLVNSNSLFTSSKSMTTIGSTFSGVQNGGLAGVFLGGDSLFYIYTSFNFTTSNDELFNTPIEIRVYN